MMALNLGKVVVDYLATHPEQNWMPTTRQKARC